MRSATYHTFFVYADVGHYSKGAGTNVRNGQRQYHTLLGLLRRPWNHEVET